MIVFKLRLGRLGEVAYFAIDLQPEYWPYLRVPSDSFCTATKSIIGSSLSDRCQRSSIKSEYLLLAIAAA